MRISLSRSRRLATILLCSTLACSTGCTMSGWKNSSPSWMSSWYKPWGSSKETNLAVTKPSTAVPSSAAKPGATALASDAEKPNFWTGTTRSAAANTPANVPASYPATGQAYNYPTQPAAGYQANPGATPTATPAVGYQTGPYGMTSTAAAPATTAPAYAQAAQSWNLPAQPAQPAATVPTGGYGASPYSAAPAQSPTDYQAAGGYQVADQRGMTAAPAGGSSYGPAASYGARSGYGSDTPSYGAGSTSTPSYGTPTYGSGSPAAGGYQAPASSGGYQGYGAPASQPAAPPTSYNSGSPYSSQGASTGGSSYDSTAVYQPDTQPQPAANVSTSQFAMPASLTTSGGYRPGSTGRSDVQNAGYDSTAAAPSSAPSTAMPSYSAPTYGNTYTR